MSRFGACCKCGNTELAPVYFTEYEEEKVAGVFIRTGRKRRAVSHLECDVCGHRECVDDSFDGPWYR